VVGVVVSAGLLFAALLLWRRTLIVFGAPLLIAALAALWVTVDNVFIYRRPTASPDENLGGVGTEDKPADVSQPVSGE
jgi:hypothetical protein